MGDVAFVDLERDLEVLDDLSDGSIAYLIEIESIDIVGNNLADEEYEFFFLEGILGRREAAILK